MSPWPAHSSPAAAPALPGLERRFPGRRVYRRPARGFLALLEDAVPGARVPLACPLVSPGPTRAFRWTRNSHLPPPCAASFHFFQICLFPQTRPLREEGDASCVFPVFEPCSAWTPTDWGRFTVAPSGCVFPNAVLPGVSPSSAADELCKPDKTTSLGSVFSSENDE